MLAVLGLITHLGQSHIHPPKYRCPRCSTRTCSLPCTKRHKLWAQCSGVRDPAAYVKRGDLATPSGIDRDYNFITSIERKLDHADRDAEARGVALQVDGGGEKRQRNNRRPAIGQLNMENAIRKSGAIVDRAPKGMVRSKENQTKWDNRYVQPWLIESALAVANHL